MTNISLQLKEIELLKQMILRLNNISKKITLNFFRNMILVCLNEEGTGINVTAQIYEDFFDNYNINGGSSTSDSSILSIVLDYGFLRGLFLHPVTDKCSLLKIVAVDSDASNENDVSVTFTFTGPDGGHAVSRNLIGQKSLPIVANSSFPLLFSNAELVHNFSLPAEVLKRAVELDEEQIHLSATTGFMFLNVRGNQSVLSKWRNDSPRLCGESFMSSIIPQGTQVNIRLSLFSASFARQALEIADILCLWATRDMISVVLKIDCAVLLHYHVPY